MTHQTPSSEFKDKMGTILFKAIEETIGWKDLNNAIEQANLYQSSNHVPVNYLSSSIEFADISEIQAALEKHYGLRGAQGLALRSGRAFFKFGLREFGPQFGFTDTAFRLLPLNDKISTMAQQFAGSLVEANHKKASVEEDSQRFLLHIPSCPICWGRHSDTAICHMAVGLLQEALYWISGGKYFHIEETDCIAKGDPCCTMVIQKQPLE
jgi:predicted hydrocarbon binding protein